MKVQDKEDLNQSGRVMFSPGYVDPVQVQVENWTPAPRPLQGFNSFSLQPSLPQSRHANKLQDLPVC